MAVLTWGKVLYGVLFVLIAPALLALWAARAKVVLPIYGDESTGFTIAAGGLVLIIMAMTELWVRGGGLPMNAFPPPRLVSRGTFTWLPHPIYTGFTAVCFGVSMAARSAAGLWLVTPAVALSCTALVLGYERRDLQRRFGRTLSLLPADDPSPPSRIERIRFVWVVLVPWLGLYFVTVNLRQAGIAFRIPFEDRLPVWSWTVVAYQSTYFTVALAAWFARTRRDLRRLIISAWVAMALVFPMYWIIPSIAPRRPLAELDWTSRLLEWERSAYPPTAAFPSFHVLWAIFVARLWRSRRLGLAYVAAVAVSCVTTGMHFVADVAAAFALAPFLLQPWHAWERLRRGAERLANSWREWRLGRLRVINHGFYAGAGAAVQFAVVGAAVGPGKEWMVLFTGLAGLAGAAAWAQWIEGSSRLRRPFGFYGGFVGVAIACLFFEERWTLLAAQCLAAPWMQMLGRLRCLVNGCCHGAPAPAYIGIRVTAPQSRVTRIAALGNVPIHPTQLYSILCNLLLGTFLARLWIGGSPLALICGVYAIGNGIARFVEEAYRGEPQTPVHFGLRLYQWIATGMVLLGSLLTCLPSPSPEPLEYTGVCLAGALTFGLLAACAMGVDFPESHLPLARLT